MLLLVPLALVGTASSQKTEERSAKAVILRQGDRSIIEASVRGRLAAGSGAAVMVYKTERKRSQRIINRDNVPDCGNDVAAGEVCKTQTSPGTIVFKYALAEIPDQEATFDFGYFITDMDKGDVGEMVKVSPVIERKNPVIDKITSSEISNEFKTEIKGHPNGEISVSVNFAASGKTSPELRAYLERRIDALYGWLEPQMTDPEHVAKIRIEPRTKRSVYDFKVVAMRLEPEGQRDALGAGVFNIVLVTNRNFPPGKFDMEVEFSGTPPMELQGKLLSSDNIPAMKLADARNAGNDKTYELRDLKSNLDLALAYTSSVETTKVGNRTVRDRKNNAVMDLQFAPLLDWHKDGDFKNYFTPFLLDAKVSNGKISSKTLSLNRIVFGTEYTRRDVMLGPRDKNKFIYTFRGLSASDRDFKRAEAKFNFEFRPLFYRLYSPIGGDVAHVPSVIFAKKKEDKEVPKHNYGYQIQPFIGVDLGGLYRNRRTAFDAEDPGRLVRRLYLGTDMIFNLTQHANVTISDKFYIRGENVRNRTRNYFHGEVQAILFNSADTSQCLFFSFERGDLPPFSTPSVNSLKIGYRITSNFFQRRP